MELEKLDKNRFRIPKEAMQGMNTDVIIYSSDALIEKVKRDRTLQQAANAATLPHLVGNILAMPDAHEGYGFPIGGVMAFDAGEGIVSPGAVGFDINCLHPESRVYDENGAWHRIKDTDCRALRPLSLDTKNSRLIDTETLLFMKKKEYRKILQIRTKLGKEILATADHPILTKKGMVKAGSLRTGQYAVTYGLEGIEYRKPMGNAILTREILSNVLEMLGISKKGNAKTQILNVLSKLELDEVDTNSSKLPLLLKLIGFVTGDGTIPHVKSGTRYTSFYGKKDDLETVAHDISRLGFKAQLRSRKRHHKIKTIYGITEFDYEENSLRVMSTAFSAVLIALGAPFGNKSAKTYRIPEWIMNAEDWQKRLFLASYFGAELSTPKIHKNGFNFYAPIFSVNKLRGLQDNAIGFLLDIRKMLESLGIETWGPSIVEGYRYMGKHGETVGFRLAISSDSPNLHRFFSTVGYLYNKEKERLSSLAAGYLSYLDRARCSRDVIRQKVVQMHMQGLKTAYILESLATEAINPSFIKHSIWGRTGKSRIYGSLKFHEFIKAFELQSSGLIYDEIVDIKELEYDGDVFDITVESTNHNFISNGIVVSNCGVRLVKTNLEEKDVRPRLNGLADALFHNVPSGVGSKLQIGLTQKDLEKVAHEGVEYIIGKGYGNESDLSNIEESGCMHGADISKVSDSARSRGLHELGTLGAGNHFLEVQKVDKIFDERTAKKFGIHENQVVIMVHTGSRGFGHQICSDYLRTLAEYQRKNNIQLADPELSYAHMGSKEALDYLCAMKSAVNYAFTNRQIITDSIRKSFESTFGQSSDAMGMEILYDLSHNIVKAEDHVVEGKRRKLLVHRKGATRAFAKGRQEIPEKYRDIGQPVLIPGSMGTASYVLCGAEGSMQQTFGSSCHGAGRVMSRHQAIREIPASRTFESLKKKSIEIRIKTRKLVSEEAEWSYKDVDEVVKVVEDSGISTIVSRNVPVAVIKG